MAALRGLLYAPSGRRTKWLVVLFWLILVVVAGPLSGKLTGAEKNDSSSWLPPAAESTQVLNLRSSAISPNVYPGVLVYDRRLGLTAADKAKAAADAAKLAKLDGAVPGSVSADHRRRRQGDGDHRPGQPGQQGLERGGPRRHRHEVHRGVRR